MSNLFTHYCHFFLPLLHAGNPDYLQNQVEDAAQVLLQQPFFGLSEGNGQGVWRVNQFHPA